MSPKGWLVSTKARNARFIKSSVVRLSRAAALWLSIIPLFRWEVLSYLEELEEWELVLKASVKASPSFWTVIECNSVPLLLNQISVPGLTIEPGGHRACWRQGLGVQDGANARDVICCGESK